MKQSIYRLISILCHWLPIKQNKIFLFSYYGSQYGCNPKYITEYMVHHARDSFDIVWAFHDPEHKKTPAGIRKVKTMSWRYFYELATAKVIITNYRMTTGFRKRKGQYYIQTWHSSLRLKRVEMDALESLHPAYIKQAKQDAAACDLLLSGCTFSTQIFQRAFWYAGEIASFGTPRNDLLLRPDPGKRHDILQQLGIPKHHQIALYAPTFRKGNSLTAYQLDYQELRLALERKFGGSWTVVTRFHPHLIPQISKLVQVGETIDATTYDDIQELLFASDVLVTDYSSLMFDFALTKRPCFLYMPDLQQYVQQDRSLYFKLSELPFPQARDHDMLRQQIQTFQHTFYQRKIAAFQKRIGSFESGSASEQLVHHIEAVCYGQKRSGRREAI